MAHTRGRQLLAGLAGTTLLVAALAGCGQPAGDDAPSPDETTTEPATDEPGDDPTDETSDDQPADERVEAAVADLSGTLGVEPDAVAAGPLEEVTWTDGSIGCPQEGQQYTQALVPGTRLILVVDDTEYAYHGEGDEPLTYCENPTDPAPSDTETA